MKVNFTPERKLVLTPDFYSSIVRFGSELITVVNSEGYFQYLSDSIGPSLGYTQSDLLGTHVFELIHPEDTPRLQEFFYDLALGGKHQFDSSPFRYKAKDGSWRWLSSVVTNMLDNPHVRGIVTNSRDITPQMEALQQKSESQAYYKALYFNNPDLVFTLSPLGEVQACNDAVVSVLGYTREDFPSSHFADFVLPEYQQQTFSAFYKAVQGKPCTFEACIRHHNGSKRHITATLVPVILEGTVQAVQCIAKDSTSEKEANKLVELQAKKLQNILSSMTEGFYALDHNWRYSFGNGVFARFLKSSVDYLMGRRIWEEYPWLGDTLFYQKCHEVAESRETGKFDEYFPHLGVTLRFTLTPFEDGILVSFVDISDQVAAQEELRKLSLVASKTTNGVIISNSQGEIEWVNDAFTKVTGYTLADVLMKRTSDVLTSPDTDPREIAWIRDQLSQGIPMRKELRNCKKNGELIWADVTISPIRNEQGQVIKHVYIHTDITERKLEQEQLLKATEHLYNQNQDLQQFNYIVSHNLRAPVANLVGLSALLQKLDPNSSRFADGLQNLQKSAHRLDDVISDLNKLLVMRSDSANITREQVSVPEVANEVINSLQYLIDQVGGSVQVQLHDDDILYANRAYVYSILHNLISNAIKYKSQLRDVLIEVKSVRVEKGLQLIVKDNGSGMDMELVRSRLFQLYKRFHTGPEGKGIGLYLVKMQVNAIGGRIEVDSAPEAGTTFTLHFDKPSYDAQSLHS